MELMPQLQDQHILYCKGSLHCFFPPLPFLLLCACRQLLKGQSKRVRRQCCTREVRDDQIWSGATLVWWHWCYMVPEGRQRWWRRPCSSPDTLHQMSQESEDFFFLDSSESQPWHTFTSACTPSHSSSPPRLRLPSWCFTLSRSLPLPPPFFFSKSKFPVAARSAECCCLLCTHKFAEAVSCPQTSAPWSGAGRERQGLDWSACCSL